MSNATVTPAIADQTMWANSGVPNCVEPKGLRYGSGGSPDWLKMKNADAPEVKREEEEQWSKRKP
jgi:hypothetical protein